MRRDPPAGRAGGEAGQRRGKGACGGGEASQGVDMGEVTLRSVSQAIIAGNETNLPRLILPDALLTVLAALGRREGDGSGVADCASQGSGCRDL